MQDKTDQELKFYWPIIVFAVAFQLVTDVTSGKTIQLGPAQLSVASLYFPVTYIISDILTEVYGYSRARRAIWIVLIASILSTVVYQFALWVPPATSFEHQSAYEIVLGVIPRIVVFGWIAVFVGDIANNYVLAKLKVWTNGRALWLRTITSTIIGQGLNTAIFYTGALSGILPSDILVSAILWAWALKVLIEVMFTPATYLCVGYLKRKEGIDVYDVKTDFNPIKL